MKKYFFVYILFFIFFLTACNNEPSHWITISISENEDAVFYNVFQPDNTIKSYIDTETGKELVFNLSLIPESNKYIDVIKVYSTNPDVACIKLVDIDSRTITVKTLKTGEAKIIVKTKSFNGCTSSIIKVN